LRLEQGGFPPRRGEIEVCLVYPNTYEVGMANLGFQLVYRMLNQMEGVVCERAFFDGKVPVALESGRQLREFDIVGFSLSYELDFLNILKALRAARIPAYSEQRRGLPVLMLGGVAAFSNPLPYAPFFDLVCIGEAEGVLEAAMDIFKKSRQKPGFLEDVSKTNGIWVPGSGKRKVRRVWAPDLNAIHSTAVCISPLMHFKNMLLVEVERGCPFRCRFCLATQAYKPYRFKTPKKLIEEIEESPVGARSVGLIGAAISEVPELSDLLNGIPGREAIASSSLRLDRVQPDLLGLLVKRGLTRITVAPEAGTERLRRIIDKRIEDDRILELAVTATSLGVKRLKLYFMVGLPFETDDDASGIVELVRKVRRRYRGSLAVSLNPFVPKPHTPFQFHQVESKEVLTRRTSLISNELRKTGVRLVVKSTRHAMLQAALSLGDEEIGEAVFRTIYSESKWTTTLRERGIDPERYLGHKRIDASFPWDLVDFGLQGGELAKSYKAAQRLSRD